ncbi:MAG: glutamate--tRNA ligase [Bacillota bacterium]
MKKIRTRFAPSPTGFLHIGGLRTALYSYLYAKKNGGDFVLRIEDTDQTRLVEGATELIYDTLRETGLIWDEGPDCGGPYGPYIQSERREIYKQYAEKLVEMGGAYYCFCDKERLESLTDEHGQRKYDKKCTHLSNDEIAEKLKNGEPYVIRQNIPSFGSTSYVDEVYGEVTFDYKDMEDNVLLKSDGMPTYNFANVVDDHLMGINVVMRGTEYLSSTPKYNLLYDSFGWERPTYIHMPPIMKNSKEKLSKRHGDASYADFIKSGFIKEAILNYIALLGWAPRENVEKMTFEKMMELFGVDGISKNPAIFDVVKMKWLNGEYFKQMSEEEFFDHALPYIEASDAKDFDHKKLALLMKTRVELLTEIPEKINFLGHFDDFDLGLYTHKKSKTNPEVAKEVLPKCLEVLKGVEDWNTTAIHDVLMSLIASLEMKNATVLWCFRIAITGSAMTPGGAMEMADLLGRELTLARLEREIERLG